jgi:hypothetical protein
MTRILFYCSLCLLLFLSVPFLPFILTYYLILRSAVWVRWNRRGKDVLVVFSEGPTCRERMSRIMPLVGSRSELLNWSERTKWNRWSLAPQLFAFYRFLGPQPFQMESALPAILVVRKFHWPRSFDFLGNLATRDSLLERLEQELNRP